MGSFNPLPAEYKAPDYIFQGLSNLGAGIGRRLSESRERDQKDKEVAREDAKREQENKGLMEGFKKVYEASPELQKMMPIKDWGDVAPNQVRGMMSTIGMMGEGMKAKTQQLQAQQAEQEMQDRVTHRKALGATVGAADPKEWLQKYTGAGGNDPETIVSLMKESQQFTPKWIKDPESGAMGMTTSDKSAVPVDMRKTGGGEPGNGPRMSMDGRFFWDDADGKWKQTSEAGATPGLKLTPYDVKSNTMRQMQLEGELTDLGSKMTSAHENRLWPGDSKGAIRQQMTDKERELAGVRAVLEGGGSPAGGGGRTKEQARPPAGVPKVGEVREGFKFAGGDPSDRKNWVKVQ